MSEFEQDHDNEWISFYLLYLKQVSFEYLSQKVIFSKFMKVDVGQETTLWAIPLIVN